MSSSASSSSVNYDNRVFAVRDNFANGEVGGETVFRYHQTGDRLTGTFEGGAIEQGHLVGAVHVDGSLTFVYHHVTTDGDLWAGRCESELTHDEAGRLVLRERWPWFTGDRTTGTSELVEVDRRNRGCSRIICNHLSPRLPSSKLSGCFDICA